MEELIKLLDNPNAIYLVSWGAIGLTVCFVALCLLLGSIYCTSSENRYKKWLKKQDYKELVERRFQQSIKAVPPKDSNAPYPRGRV